METRNVTIILEKAREWFYSEDASLKEIALQAFNQEHGGVSKVKQSGLKAQYVLSPGQRPG